MHTIMSTWAVLAAFVMIAMTVPAMAERGGDRDRPKIDTDGDGYISQEEFSASKLSEKVEFSAIDTDGDDRLSQDEVRAYARDNMRERRRGRRNQ